MFNEKDLFTLDRLWSRKDVGEVGLTSFRLKTFQVDIPRHNDDKLNHCITNKLNKRSFTFARLIIEGTFHHEKYPLSNLSHQRTT